MTGIWTELKIVLGKPAALPKVILKACKGKMRMRIKAQKSQKCGGGLYF